MNATLALPDPRATRVPGGADARPLAAWGLVETVALTAPPDELALSTLTAIVSSDVFGVTIT